MILYINANAQSPAAALLSASTESAPSVAPEFVFGDRLSIDMYLVDGQGSFDERSGDPANSIRVALGPIGGPLVAYQPSWSAIDNGFRGELDLNTDEADDLLGDEESVQTWFEIEIIEPGPNPQTLVHQVVELRRELIPNTPNIPTPIASYTPTSDLNKNFVQNRFGITGLTGGGSTNLDGIVTLSAVDTGTMVAIVIGGTVYFYQLQNSTAAEASPTYVRPDDYNNPSNARVWKLVSPLSYTGFAGFTHTQSSPASTWTVTHNFGYRPSGISVWTTHFGAEKLTRAEIVHLDNNSFEVRHRTDLSGTVRCI